MAITPLTWPRPVDDIDSFQSIAGVTYRIRGGKVYSWPANVLQSTLYDINYITNNYKTDGTIKYVTDPTTLINYPVFITLNENYIGKEDIFDLIGPSYNWNAMTLQSPMAPTIADYVALKQKILAGGRPAAFLDNRMDVVFEKTSVASLSAGIDDSKVFRKNMNWNQLGPGSLFKPNKNMKFFAAAKGSTSLTKCSLDNELLFFSKGDTLKITCAFYIESGNPTTIYDTEASYIDQGPGLRIIFDSSLVPRVELKWGDKPTFTQNSSPVALQTGRWHKIRSEFFLTDDPLVGTVKVWIDDVLKIDRVGQTLPTPDAVYTRIETGITANSNNATCTVYFDHFKINSD